MTSLMGRVLTAHQVIYERTGGRIGRRLLGVPCLLLTTTGRRTGQRRSSALVYAEDGGDYLVVASAGGSDRAPGWLHNLRAQPEVEILVGPRQHRVTAREVGPDDADYPRLWDVVNRNNRNRYRGYASKTSRKIPVVVLTPR